MNYKFGFLILSLSLHRFKTESAYSRDLENIIKPEKLLQRYQSRTIKVLQWRCN